MSDRSRWKAFLRWFVDSRLVVVVAAVLLVGGGLYVAPFDIDLGELPRAPVPVDAIPDIGENQQIVFSEWPGRSPRDVEDQVTYPLTTALMGIPGVRTVRSSSAFGFSSIYLIFEDDVDFYWSRSRVLEKLASLPAGTVPDEVNPRLGPDATALGQVFWYTLEGQDPEGNTVGGWDPDELRSIQDWTVRYALQAVDGVSEVASVGGFVREYQVDVNPEALRAHGVTLAQVADAVRRSNLDVGARTLEVNNVEYVVRGIGQLEGVLDLEASVVAARRNTPIRVRDVAHVTLGPGLRRGALDDEGAPAVGGVVVARYRENPLAVIQRVKDKIQQIQPGLPQRVLDDGTKSQVEIVPFYDRTDLIHETLGTLSTALLQQILITVIVVLIMLRNLRSSFLVSALLPLSVLLTFIMMKSTGVDANIMALGGIAIAIGTMVDIGIVFVENINQHIEANESDEDLAEIVSRAGAEVAPAVVTSVLTTAVSFLPVFALTESDLRLFAPLAFTKTFAMVAALLLALIALPTFSFWLLRPSRHRPAGVQRTPSGSTPARRLLVWTLRNTRLRDWVLVMAGALLCAFDLLAGSVVLALAISKLARPLLNERANARLKTGETIAAVLGVAFLLTRSWLPLGPGLLANLVFVAVILALVLGGFRLFEQVYPRLLRAVLEHKVAFLSLPVALTLFGVVIVVGLDSFSRHLPSWVRTSSPVVALNHAFPGLGRERMPEFDEGSFLYMPTTMPHASIGQALDSLSQMDAAIARIPEVDRVVGKLGRVDSPLDPAPISMIETVITYHPEYSENEQGQRVRNWRPHIRSPDDIWAEITRAAKQPGLTSAPVLMPIGARLVMLQSGMRAPMGIKVRGPDLETIEQFGLELQALLETVPSLRAETVFADRVVGKPYLEIHLDREAIGRYGLSVSDVQNVLQVALGGVTLTRTVEGRERYPVRVRYMRSHRDDIEALDDVFVPTASGQQIPLSHLAEVRYARGPQVIKSEDTFLTSYVLFDKQPNVAEVQAVQDAQQLLDSSIERGELVIPAGVSYEFAGSYQYQVESEKRLLLLVPVALALVFIILYLQFRRASTTIIVYSGVLVAVAGGFWLLWLYGQPWFLDFQVWGRSMRDLFQVDTINLSVAVWIGFIALVGIATDDGVVMSTYLDQSFNGAAPQNTASVRACTLQAGGRRIRPCLMTTATTILALLPVITSQGRGADLMVPMALPALGGMVLELVTLFVVPALYCWREEARLPRPPVSAQ